MSERERMSDELKDVESAMQPEDSGPPDTGSGTDDSDDGAVRRPLIRATLQPPAGGPSTPRQPPVFTMHQQQAQGPVGRQPNRNGRFVQDSGHPGSTIPNKGKKRSGRDHGSPQRAVRGDSAVSQQSGNRKWSSRPYGQGQHRSESGNRSLSSRQDKGRKR